MKFNTTNQIKDIVSGGKVPSALGLFFVLATTALLAKKVKARAALKDADEDVDDEYDKATDAIIRKMARENHVETQQNARDIQALTVGHNELVRKVEGHGHQISGLTHQVNNLQTVVADTVSVVRDDHDTLKWLIQTVKGLSDSIINLCLFGRKVGEETAVLRNDVDRISGGIRSLAFALVALFGVIFSWYVYQQKKE